MPPLHFVPQSGPSYSEAPPAPYPKEVFTITSRREEAELYEQSSMSQKRKKAKGGGTRRYKHRSITVNIALLNFVK